MLLIAQYRPLHHIHHSVFHRFFYRVQLTYCNGIGLGASQLQDYFQSIAVFPSYEIFKKNLLREASLTFTLFPL